MDEKSILFAQNTKNVMIKKGIRQLELAKLTGIPQGMISYYLTGKRIPKYQTMFKIAIALGVQMEDLLGSDAKTVDALTAFYADKLHPESTISKLKSIILTTIMDFPNIPTHVKAELYNAILKALEDNGL